jgi:hypothetical protein
MVQHCCIAKGLLFMRLLRLFAAILSLQPLSASILATYYVVNVICGQLRIRLHFAALGVSPLPLWGQHDPQVTNTQPLATIRIFCIFPLTSMLISLYFPAYGKERMEGCGKEERGTCFNGGPALGSSRGPRIGQIETGGRWVCRSSASTISAYCFLFSRFRFHRALDSTCFELF